MPDANPPSIACSFSRRLNLPILLPIRFPKLQLTSSSPLLLQPIRFVKHFSHYGFWFPHCYYCPIVDFGFLIVAAPIL
ncbi:Uncharacterized protein TCM_003940 [Theobroma cacao]|uniref:Uncharacterized protein n=1 Tax=Theobroma cacao TaxID=3641 RepID=A0A061DPJ9_THECC|nr:Uncharacterized protein TCM_003940 [Theobroma cacao]